MAKAPRAPASDNRILAALPTASYHRLASGLRAVSFVPGDVLHQTGDAVSYVHFPRSGVLSVIVRMADGEGSEVGTIGSDGMTGLAAVIGANASPHQLICQVGPCAAWRLPVSVLRTEVARVVELRDLLGRYTVYLLAQVSQASACHHLHSVRQRCARWLLQCHDRVGADEFGLTHEFLGLMLGVRRASVTAAAVALHEVGAIRYEHGRVRVLSRERLEGASCECYGTVLAALDRVFS